MERALSVRGERVQGRLGVCSGAFVGSSMSGCLGGEGRLVQRRNGISGKPELEDSSGALYRAPSLEAMNTA